MQNTHSYWRTDRPADVFYDTPLASLPDRAVRTYLPDEYTSRYAYPLLVLFHGRGSNDQQVLKLAPKISRRNFVGISLRGPELVGQRADGTGAFGWGGADDAEAVTEYVLRAVEQTRRTFHIHSERVYLVGVNEGAQAAYRTAFALGTACAGVASLNGSVPRPDGVRPVMRPDAVRGQRVFIGHGIANVLAPFSGAERDFRLMYAAGADVRFARYATTNKLHPDMLRDLNRWVIGHVNATTDALVLR